MAVSPELRDHILDLLDGLGGVTARSMFGGVGLYRDGVMFGLITRSDVLYFRTDDGNRGEYEAAGMAPFVPFEDGRMTMPYHEAPDHVLEDADQIRAWAGRAWEAARRNRKAGKGKKR